MALLCLIRHSYTVGNEKKQYVGSTDEPLSENGVARLRACVGLKLYPPAEAVFTSPMKRCVQTAALIYPGAPRRVVPEFAEMSFGAFEGKTYRELKDDPAYREWIGSGGRSGAPGGEDAAAFRRRSCAGFEKAVRGMLELRCRTAAAVVHGGTVMAVMERYAPGKKSFYRWQVKNCGGYLLLIDPEKWRRWREIARVEKIALPDSR